MRSDDYYWIKTASGNWYVGEYLTMDWYVCGMETPLVKEPVEVNEHSITADRDMLRRIRALKAEIKR